MRGNVEKAGGAVNGPGVTTGSRSPASAGPESTAPSIAIFLATIFMLPLRLIFGSNGRRRRALQIDHVEQRRRIDEPRRGAGPHIENFFRRRPDPVPPAAAERLVKSGRVGEASRACLHHL